MAKEQEQQKVQKQILILCVDRDGDLDAKAAVKTPIIGRRDNLDAAVTLALKDPEEPDANAMFEAVRTYDRLKEGSKPEEVYEIATISGLEPVGVEADRKIVAELNELLAFFPATEVILVVDGFSDEAVLPLIQSRVPVLSVSRIVVKHSESIEESAALFQRYAKTIWDNPRYSRWILGIPGTLALIALVLSALNLLSGFWIVLILTLSAIMIVKGFGVDRGAKKLYKWMKEYSPPPLRIQISAFAAVAGALCMVVGIYLGWTNGAVIFLNGISPAPSDWSGWFVLLPQLSGWFIKESVTLVVVGVCAALMGRAVRWYMEHDPRVLRNAALIVSLAWSRQIIDAASDLLIAPTMSYDRFIFYVVVGILIGIISVIVIFVAHRRFKEFFGETTEQVEDFEKS
jgi:putative membrane protein